MSSDGRRVTGVRTGSADTAYGEPHAPALQESRDLVADMATTGQVEHLFSTPVFSYVLKEADALNTELTGLVLERERTAASMSRSNQGGWQSAPDFFRWEQSAVAELERYVMYALKIATARVLASPSFRAAFDLYGWASVNRRGHYNTTHVHPMSTWSGVYYVDPGDDPPDGPAAFLEFAHPVTAAVMSFFPNILPSARVVRPVAGMIILFPSYLQHSVRMYGGNRPRISIPFNAHLRDAAA